MNTCFNNIDGLQHWAVGFAVICYLL